jgi:hypothetical protein
VSCARAVMTVPRMPKAAETISVRMAVSSVMLPNYASETAFFA